VQVKKIISKLSKSNGPITKVLDFMLTLSTKAFNYEDIKAVKVL